MNFTDKEIELLKEMATDWHDDGFKSQPYPQEYNELLQKLGVEV